MPEVYKLQWSRKGEAVSPTVHVQCLQKFKSFVMYLLTMVGIKILLMEVCI